MEREQGNFPNTPLAAEWGGWQRLGNQNNHPCHIPVNPLKSDEDMGSILGRIHTHKCEPLIITCHRPVKWRHTNLEAISYSCSLICFPCFIPLPFAATIRRCWLDAFWVVFQCRNALHQLTEKYIHIQGIPKLTASYTNIIQEPKLCDPSWNKKTMKISKNFPPLRIWKSMPSLNIQQTSQVSVVIFLSETYDRNGKLNQVSWAY